MRRDPSTPRLGWPLLLLVVGVGCIALALVEATRSIRSNDVVKSQALKGYANFASWSYAEHLTQMLGNATQEILGIVNMVHSTPPVPDARDIGHGLHWDVGCACHRPRFGPMPAMFLGFTLGADTLEIGRNQAPPGTTGWLVDPLTDISMQAARLARLPRPIEHWLIDTLTNLARAPRTASGYHYLILQDGDSTVFAALTTMPTSWGDTLVYAVQYGGAAFDSLLGAVLDDPKLLPAPLAERHANRDILGLEVSDERGRILYASNVPAVWTTDAISRVSPYLGGLAIRMQFLPNLAGEVVIGGLPRSRLPMLLALLGLAAGLTVIAVGQLRREARFAADRSAFVSNVSHELRTPLAQIRLVTDMLRLGREPDAARRDAALALVDREVTRLQLLVESVLRFTRGERPGEAAPREPVDVAAEARTTVAEFEPLATPRGVTVDVVVSGSPVVSLRAGALRQVLLNLLDNAVKYGPDGGTISVSVEPGSRGGARLRVCDEGPGVPAAERERIWQPYERGSAASDRAVGGSGIGLTVVREIVELHGGTATVSSRPGGGAEFVVEFPGGEA